MPEIFFHDEDAEFLIHLTNWHSNRVEQLESMVSHIKEGTIIKFGDDDAEAVTLNEDMARGFTAGIHTALMMLGVLPFQVSRSDFDDGSPGDEEMDACL